MAIIRLINTTTPLRVDAALECDFFRIVNPAFKAAIEKQGRDLHVDVQLVGRDDTDLARDDASHRDGIPDTDLLGIYVSHSRSSHHPVIKVCPERLLDACQRWNHKISGALPCTERYPALLYAVVIHELAHFLMDDQLISDQCRPISWSEFIRRLSVDAASDATEWNNHPVPDQKCEKSLQTTMASTEHNCTVNAKTRAGLIGKYPVDMQLLDECETMIEESLANAFVLNQSFGTSHLTALSTFVESQSAPYKAGLRWKRDIARLLKTVASWKRFKVDDIGMDGRKWLKAPLARRDVLTGLAQRLITPGEAIASFDFQKGA
jgi:hypothetical protein